jgi:hypothetical protein
MELGDVNIHTDDTAVQLSRDLGSQAFTYGRDVFFNREKYQPETHAGRHLLAHELTHVAQQSGGVPWSTGNVAATGIQSTPWVQRQCEGDVGEPAEYAAGAAANLRCNETNTGIPDVAARLTAGRRRAQVMVNDALTVLERLLNGTASQAARDQFQRVFGGPNPPTPGQVRAVRRTFNSICAWLTSAVAQGGGSILCLTHDAGRCSGGRVLATAACVRGQTTRRPVNICPDGISVDATSTGQTVIHEAAHRFGICPDRDVDETYEGSNRFPTQPPVSTSADSYSAFAREASQLMGDERVQQMESSNPQFEGLRTTHGAPIDSFE